MSKVCGADFEYTFDAFREENRREIGGFVCYSGCTP